LPANIDSDFTVRPYEAGDRGLWDRLVGESRSAHFLFRRDYMEYHRDRFEDASLIVLAGEAPIALLPASRDGSQVVSHGGLTFGGLVSTEALTTRRTVAVLGAVIGHLQGEGVTRLRYKAVPHIYHSIPAEEDLYALFVHGAELVRRDIAATLRPSSRPRYSKGRKAALRQAQRSGMEVAREQTFAEFMALEREALRRRYGADPVHTGEEMELLAAAFPENIKLFTARRDGLLLGGVLIYETASVAHAQYIGASEVGYEAHALDFVIDYLIEDEYADKRWFDLGTSTTEEGRSLNTGLMRSKESYGARAVAYDTYSLNLEEATRALV
jgi:hypothetical protein